VVPGRIEVGEVGRRAGCALALGFAAEPLEGFLYLESIKWHQEGQERELNEVFTGSQSKIGHCTHVMSPGTKR
jgi:hypothetical protein